MLLCYKDSADDMTFDSREDMAFGCFMLFDPEVGQEIRTIGKGKHWLSHSAVLG